jgi:hypothetical protein
MSLKTKLDNLKQKKEYLSIPEEVKTKIIKDFGKKVLSLIEKAKKTIIHHSLSEKCINIKHIISIEFDLSNQSPNLINTHNTPKELIEQFENEIKILTMKELQQKAENEKNVLSPKNYYDFATLIQISSFLQQHFFIQNNKHNI